MRRLAALLALVAVAVLGLPTVVGAGNGGGSATVTIAHAMTYSANDDFPVTVCVDDAIIDDDFRVGELIGPTDFAPGTYDVEIFYGQEPDCTGDPDVQADVPLAAGDDVTIMAYWPATGPTVTVLPNDSSCVEPGEARVTARHGATAGPVNVFATPDGGDELEILSDIASGQQGITDVPAGTYDVQVRAVSDDSLVVDIPDAALAESTNTVVYVLGGGDGPIGFFVDVIELGTCEQPTTTTTTIETTTTAPEPAPAAQAQQVTPAFTG